MNLKNIKYLSLLAFPAVLFSCAKEQQPDTPSDETVEVSLTLENGRLWKEADEVIVNGVNHTVETDGKSSTITLSNVRKADSYNAAYDFGGGICEGQLLTLNLPSVVSTASDNFQPMVAYNTAPVLSLKNVTGKLSLKLTGSADIARLVLTAAGGEKISGDASIALKFSGAPSIKVDGSETYSNITLIKSSPVALPASFDFILPAAVYEGFFLTAYDADGNAMTAKPLAVSSISRGETTEIEAEYVQDEGEPVYLTVTAQEDALGVAAQWTSASQLYVNGVPAQLFSGAGETTAQFGPVAEAETYCLSTSNGSAAGVSGNIMRVNLPSRQSNESALCFRNPAVAATTSLSAELKYLGAVAKVHLQGQHIITSAELTSLTTGARMSGSGTVNLSAEPYAFTLNADASSSVVLTTGNLDTSAGADVYFVISEGNYADGFYINLTDAAGVEMNFTLPAAKLERNKVTELGLVNWEGSAGSEGDLSLKGCANCYMVHTAGDYHFRTRMIDNSNVPGVASADWLWQSPAGLVDNVEYSDGTISFKAGSGKGNALIAAFDEKGNIVWSWHIWFTDKPALHDLGNNVIYQGGGATDGYYPMDRNLGATGTTGDDAFGLLYQWGRKDPFFGGTSSEWERNADTGAVEKVSDTFSEANTKTVFNSKYAVAKWENVACTKEIGTIEWALAHPMSFIYAGPDSNQSDWLHKSNLTADQKYDPDKSLWRPFQKSIYDPCPPGYQVPRNSTFNCLNTAAGIFTPNQGYLFPLEDGTRIWIPYQGYRSANYNDGGALLSVKGTNGAAFVWSSELQVAERAYSLQILQPSVYGQNDDPWGNGLAVRCVKEYK